MDDTTDIRGRAVVWRVGETVAGTARERRRVWRGRLGLAAVSLAALVALVSGTAAWSVLTPVGSDPQTPLWIAPPRAVADHATARPTVRSTPARPEPSGRSSAADDHGRRHGGHGADDASGAVNPGSSKPAKDKLRTHDHPGSDDKGGEAKSGSHRSSADGRGSTGGSDGSAAQGSAGSGDKGGSGTACRVDLVVVVWCSSSGGSSSGGSSSGGSSSGGSGSGSSGSGGASSRRGSKGTDESRTGKDANRHGDDSEQDRN